MLPNDFMSMTHQELINHKKEEMRRIYLAFIEALEKGEVTRVIRPEDGSKIKAR